MLKKLLLDRRGSIAPIFAVAIIPLLLAAGAAMDYSKVADYGAKMQNAADAAALAGVVGDGNKRERKRRMAKFLKSNLPSDIMASVKSKKMRYNNRTKSTKVNIKADVPMAFMRLIGISTKQIEIEARAKAAATTPRVFDLVMCIDGTGSMQATINSVKSNVLGFQQDLNREMTSRRLENFDAVRAKAIVYRDYGGNNRDTWSQYYHVSSGGYVDKSPNGSQWRPRGDAKNYGDDEPMAVSSYFNLPVQQGQLKNFLDNQNASGGGDSPEAGLECINKAMDSDWLKKGDPVPGGTTPIKEVHSTIVLWTDIDAQPLSFHWSLKNPSYPPASVMPRNYSGLKAKWDNPPKMNPKTKLLVTFMPNGISTRVWDKLKTWDNYYKGGTLNDGNTRLIDKIVDALQSLPSNTIPVLTQ